MWPGSTLVQACYWGGYGAPYRLRGVIIAASEMIRGIPDNLADNAMAPRPYRGLPYRCILTFGHPMNRSILHIVAVGMSAVLAAQADQKVTQPTPLYELQIRGIGG